MDEGEEVLNDRGKEVVWQDRRRGRLGGHRIKGLKRWREKRSGRMRKESRVGRIEEE